MLSPWSILFSNCIIALYNSHRRNNTDRVSVLLTADLAHVTDDVHAEVVESAEVLPAPAAAERHLDLSITCKQPNSHSPIHQRFKDNPLTLRFIIRPMPSSATLALQQFSEKIKVSWSLLGKC